MPDGCAKYQPVSAQPSSSKRLNLSYPLCSLRLYGFNSRQSLIRWLSRSPSSRHRPIAIPALSHISLIPVQRYLRACVSCLLCSVYYLCILASNKCLPSPSLSDQSICLPSGQFLSGQCKAGGCCDCLYIVLYTCIIH